MIQRLVEQKLFSPQSIKADTGRGVCCNNDDNDNNNDIHDDDDDDDDDDDVDVDDTALGGAVEFVLPAG